MKPNNHNWVMAGALLICLCIASVTASPLSDFTGAPNSGTAPVTVQFTDLSSNAPTAWAWFFGDEAYTQSWTQQTANAGWSARGQFSSVVMPDGSIVLMGGHDGSVEDAKNDVWKSTDKGNTWTQVVEHAEWSGRLGHSGVVLSDGSIIISGGTLDGGFVQTNDVWRSVNGGATWTLMTAHAGWSQRYGHTSTVMKDDSIILTGGFTFGDGYQNDVWKSTDKGATWTQIKENNAIGWSARIQHSCVAMPDGSIVLMGGYYDSNDYNDVWRSTDNGATWMQLPDAGWTARSTHTCVAIPDGSIVMMGGYDSGGVFNKDVWRSTDSGATWAQLPDAGWSARAAQSSVVLPDSSIVLMGGGVNGGSGRTNDVWRFMPAGSSAQNPSHTYITPGTYSVALQVYNTLGYNSMQKTGYISVTRSSAPVASFTAAPTTGTVPMPVAFTDSSTNTPTGWAWYFGDETYTAPWTQQTASAGWPVRAWHSSVVLPDASIVLLGGMDSGFNRMNDVWRSTDNGATWTQQTPSAGWSARYGQTSVVTPDGSIELMGGYDIGGYLNDTWRSTDKGATWTLVNGSSGWSPRYVHTSVSMPDGSIILMGGSATGGDKNDVWRSTDYGATWMQLTTSAEWLGRQSFGTVSMPDGSIVLMGGWVSGVRSNDVWRSTDYGATWTKMSDGAWTGRYDFSSVSMPDSSIVMMGGVNTMNKLNEVLRSTDNGATWTQIDASAGWLARYGQSSVVMPDGSIVLMGGTVFGSDGGDVNDVWQFQPVGSSAQNPLHTYNAPGIYSVALQVYNSGERDTTQKAEFVTVTGPSVPGSLEVKSSPSHAKIYIDGIDTGKYAKWTFDDMAPGDYDVFVTLDGYTTPKSEKITVISEQTVELHFKLKKEETPVPEFPTSLLPTAMIIGILGTVFYIQRTRLH